MSFFPKSWGQYPPEYNRKIHGFYDPSMYYGKRDTPFGDVKLGELTAWFGRRRKTPSAMVQAVSRAYWRYVLAWVAPKRPGVAGFLHFGMCATLVCYTLSYKNLQQHRNYRYH